MSRKQGENKLKWPPNQDLSTFFTYLFSQLASHLCVGEGLGIPHLGSNASLCNQPVVGAQYIFLKYCS